VWVDGQYVGFVKELAGDKKLMLLPGKHEIVIRHAWYDEFVKQVILEPGQTHQINVTLVKSARMPTRDATGELKIAATPSRAAVFVDGQYAGHVDEFDGVGKAMLLTPDSTACVSLYLATCPSTPWWTCAHNRSSRFRLIS